MVECVRFTFPKTDQAYVILDANPGGSSIARFIRKATPLLAGFPTSKGTASNFALYFVAVFDRKFTTQGTWDESGAKDNNRERSGNYVGAYVGFSTREGEAVSFGGNLA